MTTETAQTVTDLHPWCTPGTRVAILTGSYGRRQTKVKKVGKTRVTLEDGSIFYIPKHGNGELREMSGGYRYAELVEWGSEKDLARVREIADQRIFREAKDAAEAFGKMATVESTRAAIEKLQAHLQRIEK